MRKFTSLLLLGFALGSFAQTPGGVSGSELWFKTAPLNSDLQGYYRWQDFSGDSIRLMLLDSRGVKSELTLPNSSVHYFNFNPSLWLADGFRSLSAKLKHGNLSQATVIGVFAPEMATIGKDMVLYALDGRKGDGAILSKDKAVRQQTIQTEGIFGYRDGGNNTQYNNNAEYSMAAVLNAITGGKDFSNGAIRWDGFDLAIKGWEHVKSKNQGLGISRSHYQTFYSYWAGGNRLKNASGNKNAIFNPEFQMLGKKLTYSPAIQGYWKGMVLYNSSAAYGGTIFWRPVSNFIIKGVNLNRNFRKVNGSKNKPL